MGLTLSWGAFLGGAVAAIGIGGGLSLFFMGWMADGKPPRPDKTLLWLIVSFLVSVSVLNFLSVSPEDSWKMTARMASVLLPLALLSCRSVQSRVASSPKALIWWPLFFIAGAAALGADMATGSFVLKALKGIDGDVAQELVFEKYNRGLTYLLLFVMPVAASALRLPFGGKEDGQGGRIALLLAMAAALALPLMLTRSSSAVAALAFGTVVAIAAAFFPKAVAKSLYLALPLAAGWPFIARAAMGFAPDIIGKLPPSWLSRVEIWDYMSYRIGENPFAGWGIGTAKLFSIDSPHSASYRLIFAPAAHSHNAATQLWVETGALGLAVGLAFAAVMLRRAEKLGNGLSPFALGAWAYAYALSMVAFDFWSDSLLSAFALTAFAFAVLRLSPPLSPQLAAQTR